MSIPKRSTGLWHSNLLFAGIGLSIANKSVSMNAGRIWVESEVGEGSTFFFTLPKQKMEAKK
jgi:signal transduction histidine kinase